MIAINHSGWDGVSGIRKFHISCFSLFFRPQQEHSLDLNAKQDQGAVSVPMLWIPSKLTYKNSLLFTMATLHTSLFCLEFSPINKSQTSLRIASVRRITLSR